MVIQRPVALVFESIHPGKLNWRLARGTAKPVYVHKRGIDPIFLREREYHSDLAHSVI